MISSLERLQDIFRDIFDDENLVLMKETTADDIEDWDSLAMINIIVACEQEFGIKFSFDDIKSFRNAGDMAEVIERKQQ